MKKAVCLISGGMDSYVAAAEASKKGYSIHALTVNYGQKNNRELSSARKIALCLKAEKHAILDLDLSWTASALTNSSIDIPNGFSASDIPPTYVPARNTIFISLAMAMAETVNADSIYIGVNAVDFSGYPDCRPEYIKRFQALIDVATKKTSGGGIIKLQAPLINMSKLEIIKEGLKLEVDFSLTWSCYRSGKMPCGRCPSCLLRAKGFRQAGVKDPLIVLMKKEKNCT
ncbi:MAG TPA: 7-cyano-7-deazaguanine synthase QueC [bacterium]|nr:7-cyano-7-deazaguanine synthase QueC [bacterium]